MSNHETTDSPPDAAQFWEARYAGVDRAWSGRPNTALVATVSDLPVGRALDLGCGEGADSIWLAERGWQVTGLDISPTAIGRAQAAAAQLDVPDGRLSWIAHDLATWPADGVFDLVSACFLHSPVEFPRTDVLRRVAALIAPGGHLLIVSHAAAPPWATQLDGHERRFLTPAEELSAIDLPDDEWQTLLAETRQRETTGPDGQRAMLDDGVVLLRRR
jgi:SAM-dependent methyltransferase